MDKFLFSQTEGGDFGESFDGADEALVVDRVFDFVKQVIGKRETFGFGAIGGRGLAETVADSEDVFGGGFEIFIDDNAGGFVFDLGVFEAVIEGGLTASGDNNAIDADHFFVFAVFEDNAFGEFVFFESNNFGAGEDGDAKFLGKIFGQSIASLRVFLREEVVFGLEKHDFNTEFGVVGSDFAASGAAADNGCDFGRTGDFNGGFGSQMFNESKVRNGGGF